MCEDQTYTDLHLVAGDGQIFAAHQVCALSNVIQFQFTRIPKTLFICEGWYTHLRSLHMQSWFVYYTFIVLIDGMKWCVFYVELSYILNVFLCLNVELFVVFINIYKHGIHFICWPNYFDCRLSHTNSTSDYKNCVQSKLNRLKMKTIISIILLLITTQYYIC